MRKTYLTPLLEVETVQIEHNFAASTNWLKQGGQGDFDYDVEEDETWG